MQNFQGIIFICIAADKEIFKSKRSYFSLWYKMFNGLKGLMIKQSSFTSMFDKLKEVKHFEDMEGLEVESDSFLQGRRHWVGRLFFAN